VDGEPRRREERQVSRVLHDVRHAARSIARMPALAAVVVASLAVGIGANGVVFSWVQAVVFTPIDGAPRASALQLVEPKTETAIYPGASWPEYRDLRERLRAIDGLLAFRMAPLYVGERGHVERASGLLVSDNYFTSLGLVPALGRFLRAEEAVRPGAAPVVVVSYDYWQTRFGGRADALVQSIRINGVDLAVIGVAPRGFKGTVMRLSFDFWIPATMAPVLVPGSNEIDDRGARGYTIAGYLAPGAAQAQAQADVDVVMRALAQTYPQSNRGLTAEVLPFWKAPRGPQRFLAASLVVLQSIMLLLLLAVCGNTATLLLARASARQREMSIRVALGAGRAHIARLLLAESLLLAIAGGALGAALAWWGTGLLSALPPLRVRGIPVSFETHADLTTIAFALLLGMACGVTFGFVPVLQLARTGVHPALKGAAASQPRGRARSVLMGIEVALASAVLIAGGLFLQAFAATRQEDPGFRRDGVLLAGYDLTGRNADDAAVARFVTTLLDRLRALPSLEGAAIATSVPLDIHGMPSRFFTLEGRARSDDSLDEALTNTVTPGYFSLMALPLLAGRDFVDLRDGAAPPEVIVNDAFVRRYAPGADVLGRRVTARGRAFTIVGVVRTSLYNAFGEPPMPMLYFSYRDRPSPVGEIHVRPARGAETAVAADLRRIVAGIDPDLPIYDVRTLSDHIEANLIFRRIPARMFAVLGPLLLLLAATGIYAVVAYAVSLRTAEIGVRLALGATAPRVMAEFVREHVSVAAAGALGGWLLAFAVVVDLMSGPIDAAVFAGVPLLLLAVAAAASWWPARRISAVDPLIALRAE
jgi:putative ABC transport system permease protein